MKCTRLEDWLEIHGEEAPGPDWEAMVVHARGCPDCSQALEVRSRMLETLAHLPSPPVPPQLEEMIRMTLDDPGSGETSDTNWFDEYLEPLLQPVKFGLAGACVLMVFFLGSLGLDREFPGLGSGKPRTVALAPTARRVERLPAPRTEKLAKIAPAEVEQFIHRLNEFRRLHPEMGPAAGQVPAAEVVSFPGGRP